MTSICLIFSVFGDQLHHQEFTSLTKFSPTASWLKGDLIRHNPLGMRRKETCWEYTSGYVETLFFEELANDFKRLIKPNLAEVSRYIAENNLDAKIDIVAKMENGETPAIEFDRDFISIVLALNGVIELDLYV